MKISFNQEENCIEIKDEQKDHYTVLLLLMIMNILNAILNLYDANQTGFGFLEYSWLFIGTISLVILYLFLFKRSVASRIPIQEIKGLKQKSFLLREYYSLKLVNGKHRFLGKFKNERDFIQLMNLIEDAGIRKIHG